jgi:hypothetical protein
MAQWFVVLTYPLGGEDIGVFSGAGIVRRGGRANVSSESATFSLEADGEDDVRAQVLAVRPNAHITQIRRGDDVG